MAFFFCYMCTLPVWDLLWLCALRAAPGKTPAEGVLAHMLPGVSVTHCELTEPAHCLCAFFTPTGTLTHSARSQRHGEPRLCGYHHPRERFLFWNPTFKLGPRHLMMIIVPEHWFQPRLFAKPVSLTTFFFAGLWKIAEAGSSAPAGGGVLLFPQSLSGHRGHFLRTAVASLLVALSARWCIYV